MICLSRILLQPGIFFASTEVLSQDSKPFAGSLAGGSTIPPDAQRDLEVLKEKDWENCCGYNSSRNFHFACLEFVDSQEKALPAVITISVDRAWSAGRNVKKAGINTKGYTSA